MKNTSIREVRVDYKNCIYRLYFEGDDRSYIGSTKSAKGRLRTHMWDLLRKKHTNSILQLAFNKYGYVAYRWEILESDIKPSKLLQKEYEYIKQYKADTEGFNQTSVTTNVKGKKQFIPEEVTYDNKEYIRWWLENKEIEFKEIVYSTNLRKTDNNSYSKSWWSRLTEKEIVELSAKIHNYVHHISSCRIITTMMICGGEDSLLLCDNDSYSFMVAKRLIKKFKKQPHTNRPMKDAIITSALNPLHIEMMYMTPEEINEYRVATLFRILQDCNLEEKITIHLPQKYFKGMIEVIESIGAKGGEKSNKTENQTL